MTSMEKRRSKTGPFVRRARKKSGLNQDQFAKLISVSRPELSRFEGGKTEPGGSIVLRIIELAERLKNGQNAA